MPPSTETAPPQESAARLVELARVWPEDREETPLDIFLAPTGLTPESDPERYQDAIRHVFEIREWRALRQPRPEHEGRFVAEHVVPVYAMLGEPNIARDLAQQLSESDRAVAFREIMEVTGEFQDGESWLQSVEASPSSSTSITLEDGCKATIEKRIEGISERAIDLMEQLGLGISVARMRVKQFEAEPTQQSQREMFNAIGRLRMTNKGLHLWGKAVPFAKFEVDETIDTKEFERLLTDGDCYQGSGWIS